MDSCQCRPFKRTNTENNYSSSYNRSHKHENIVDLQFPHIRIKREAGKDLRTRVKKDICLSRYNEDFGIKNQKCMKDIDYYRRSSISSKPNLKILHEEYVKNPPKPQEFGLTITGTTYKALKPILIPQIVPHDSPTKEYSYSIQSLDKYQVSPIPLNETSSCKLLDNYVSTTHLNHVNFSESQRNISKNDIITYCNTTGLPKTRGTQVSIPIGSYSHKDAKTSYRVFPRQFCHVPYSGNTTTYKKNYGYVIKNPVSFKYDIEFPVQYKLTKGDILTTPGMYCTEKYHLGTGWPLRAVLDLGRVQGTF